MRWYFNKSLLFDFYYMIISTKQLLCLELLRYIILCRRVSRWGKTSIKKRSAQGYIRTTVQQESEDILLVDLLLPLVHELSFFCIVR